MSSFVPAGIAVVLLTKSLNAFFSFSVKLLPLVSLAGILKVSV